jgi:hypothetical protein
LKYNELTEEQQIKVMQDDHNTYWHNGAVSYMGMSYIKDGRDVNCDGLGRLTGSFAQEREYKCELCGKTFITEGE